LKLGLSAESNSFSPKWSHRLHIEFGGELVVLIKDFIAPPPRPAPNPATPRSAEIHNLRST
ncbi:hypothetical protein JYU34_008813, partial [Plutella xylostella]